MPSSTFRRSKACSFLVFSTPPRIADIFQASTVCSLTQMTSQHLIHICQLDKDDNCWPTDSADIFLLYKQKEMWILADTGAQEDMAFCWTLIWWDKSIQLGISILTLS